jgi:hypothetical protein
MALVALGGGCRKRKFSNQFMEDAQAVLSAQQQYAGANGGFFDSDTACLVSPARCIPGYPQDGESFLKAELAGSGPRGGYVSKLYTAGDLAPEVAAAAGVSPTSVAEVAYVALPEKPGKTGVRALCGDIDMMCYADDGHLPPIVGGRCPWPTSGDNYVCLMITSPPSARAELSRFRRETLRRAQNPPSPETR